jgi:hypothetical protein
MCDTERKVQIGDEKDNVLLVSKLDLTVRISPALLQKSMIIQHDFSVSHLLRFVLIKMPKTERQQTHEVRSWLNHRT